MQRVYDSVPNGGRSSPGLHTFSGVKVVDLLQPLIIYLASRDPGNVELYMMNIVNQYFLFLIDAVRS